MPGRKKNDKPKNETIEERKGIIRRISKQRHFVLGIDLGTHKTGKALFKSYCYLQAGYFEKAELTLPYVVSVHENIHTLEGLVNIFTKL